MSTTFIEPHQPSVIMLEIHDHEWFEVGAQQSPNEVWRSVWACTLCPDIGLGGPVGPVPDGYCWQCHWVQRRPTRKRCEECKAPLR